MSTLVLKEGALPLVVIPSGKNLNCVKSNSEAPSFEVDGLPASSIKGAVNLFPSPCGEDVMSTISGV